MMVWSQSAGEGREKRAPMVLSCMGEVVCVVGEVHGQTLPTDQAPLTQCPDLELGYPRGIIATTALRISFRM